MITQQELIEKFEYLDGNLYYRKNGKRAGWPNGAGRIQLMIDKKYYYLHRLVWLYHHGTFPIILDHIDRNLNNNRIENLRAVTASQSSCNREEYNSSGFRGVSKFGNRWKAQIRYNNKHYHIGYFDTPEEASEAYKKKAKELHGEYAVYTSK